MPFSVPLIPSLSELVSGTVHRLHPLSFSLLPFPSCYSSPPSNPLTPLFSSKTWFVASENFTHTKVPINVVISATYLTRMPGFPVAACETSYCGSTDQPSHQDACAHISSDENPAPEESLSIYCQPVELYNILQRRARKNPLFLQKCLDYKRKAKNKKRIQMTVLLAWIDEQIQTVFPLYICLARRDPNNEDADYSAVYRISRMFLFRGSSGTNGNNQIQANFVLPEVNKLAVEARSGSRVLLFFTTVHNPNLSSRGSSDLTSHESKPGEKCLCGKVSLESLYMAWDNSPNFSLGQRAEFMSTVDLIPSILKYDFQNKGQSISIQDPCNSEKASTSKQVQITISAEEFGAKDKSPYLAYASSDVSSSSLSRIIRLKEGNVTFNYRYCNNKLQRTEVTEDFSCPFCLVRCASYKGLRCHLFSSHDLFNFEFSASEDCQAVNVSVKTSVWKPEIVADGIDPKLQTFIFCPKPFKRRSPKEACSENAEDADPPVLAEDANPPILAEDADPPVLAEDADPLVLESEILSGDTELLKKDDGASNASIASNPDPDCVPPISEHDHGTPVVLQVDKTGKLPVEHADPQIIAQLKKRQFYHSHKAQPMSLEEVLSNHDSEDEVDDEVADIEERRKFGFLNLSKEEKQFMFMWNSFIRKQRVRADGHIHWTCKAFSKLHGPELVKSPKLYWCWRMFRIKLYNHGLINARILNESSIILEEYEKQNSDSQS